MLEYFKHHPWKIIEQGYHANNNEIAESVFSLGNGMMGQRGNFEETFTGKTLQGTYLGGVYYPDKTRVGWWKNGYPEYFAKVLNSTNWMGLQIFINNEEIDLNKNTVLDFYRELDMQHGILKRMAHVRLTNNIEVKIQSERFYSLISKEFATYQLSIETSENCELKIISFLDGNISNKDSNYDEKFWEEVSKNHDGNYIQLTTKTKKLHWHESVAASTYFSLNNKPIEAKISYIQKEKYIGFEADLSVEKNSIFTITKSAIIASNFHHSIDNLQLHALKTLKKLNSSSFEEHKKMHAAAWESKWREMDVEIIGDIKAQQAVRFNIFQLNQTYCGDDNRLNIGPKGFTGEKYGGSTYWDTEAYCIPFFLITNNSAISKQLLQYRYNQLEKAIENAQKLGFDNGAALFPMVTMNGEECHNEWEITFEEIHRNGAIIYAIYNYILHTDDEKILEDFALEVIIAVARFWSQRVHFVTYKNRYEMHGVTGPNEYENNVNNNWYTNYLARWCMQYAIESIGIVQTKNSNKWNEIKQKINFNENIEITKWNDIIEKIYLQKNEKLNVYVQHDGFLEKELIPVKDLDEKHLPLVHRWSWDRILRSPYIKQADVLQGMYFFENHFSKEDIKNNFNFYEPFTVHESSLSPCVHSILACSIGNYEKAYEMYLRTARLDLDNYNNDTEDGLHITSMAGSYLSIVQGFAGLRINTNEIQLNPICPVQWQGYSFSFLYKNQAVHVSVSPVEIKIKNNTENELNCSVKNEKFVIAAGKEFALNKHLVQVKN